MYCYWIQTGHLFSSVYSVPSQSVTRIQSPSSLRATLIRSGPILKDSPYYDAYSHKFCAFFVCTRCLLCFGYRVILSVLSATIMKMENFQADEGYAIWYKIEKLYMLPLFSKREIYAFEGCKQKDRVKGQAARSETTYNKYSTCVHT